MDREIAHAPLSQSTVISLATETALLEMTITTTLEQWHLETGKSVDAHHRQQLPTSIVMCQDKTVGNRLYATILSTIPSPWKCK
jgi:hypothetical protein